MVDKRRTDSLWPNPDNPRRDIKNDPSFDGFVASVRSQGIVQPLLIRDDGMILAGHRRHCAAEVVGLEYVPVAVLKNESNHVLVPLIENLQRSDLGVLEVAEYLRRCSREHEMSATMIAEATGITASTVYKYLKLADAPVELKERVERDEIPLNAAFELLRYDQEFIHEVITTPVLTRQIVRERAKSKGVSARKPDVPKSECPTEMIPHLEYAIQAVQGLLASAPNDDYKVRYRRWIVIMEDDLVDLKPQHSSGGEVAVIGALQRQPSKKQHSGWKAT